MTIPYRLAQINVLPASVSLDTSRGLFYILADPSVGEQVRRRAGVARDRRRRETGTSLGTSQ